MRSMPAMLAMMSNAPPRPRLDRIDESVDGCRVEKIERHELRRGRPPRGSARTVAAPVSSVDITAIDGHTRRGQLQGRGAPYSGAAARHDGDLTRQLGCLFPTQLCQSPCFQCPSVRDPCIPARYACGTFACSCRETRQSTPASRACPAAHCPLRARDGIRPTSVPPNAAMHCLATRCACAGKPAMRSVMARASSSMRAARYGPFHHAERQRVCGHRPARSRE